MTTDEKIATASSKHDDQNGHINGVDHIITADEATFNYYGAAGKLVFDKDRSIHLDENKMVGAVKLPITDIRSNFQDYHLDVHGFEIVRHDPFLQPLDSNGPNNHEHGDDTSAPSDGASKSTSDPWWGEKSKVYARYYPTITRLVQDQLGVKAVLWKDFLVRDEISCAYTDAQALVKARRGPITRPHIDWSSKGMRAMLRNILPSFYDDTNRAGFVAQADIDRFFEMRDRVVEAEDRCVKAAGLSSVNQWDGKNYDGPRWGMINVWQPLEGPVRRDPLAWMDVRTAIPAEDYEGVPRWYKLYKGFTAGFEAQNWVVKPPPEVTELDENGQRKRHAWYWLSGQQKEEVTLLKIFDSEGDKQDSVMVGGCPHTSIVIEGTEDLPPRKSIEVKGFVFW